SDQMAELMEPEVMKDGDLGIDRHRPFFAAVQIKITGPIFFANRDPAQPPSRIVEHGHGYFPSRNTANTDGGFVGRRWVPCFGGRASRLLVLPHPVRHAFAAGSRGDRSLLIRPRMHGTQGTRLTPWLPSSACLAAD